MDTNKMGGSNNCVRRAFLGPGIPQTLSRQGDGGGPPGEDSPFQQPSSQVDKQCHTTGARLVRDRACCPNSNTRLDEKRGCNCSRYCITL